jgi:hypothetical protein
MDTSVPEFGQSDALRGGNHIETLQRKLKGHGFYRGTCDGEYREELQLAINRFRARVMKRKGSSATQPGCDGVTYHAILAQSGNTFAEVLRDEVNAFRDWEPSPPPAATTDTAVETAHGMKLAGLAFSGGGVRSATFNLGILQALAQAGRLRQFHYLSTVSGGGYIGSWLSRWIRSAGGVGRVEEELRKSVAPKAGEREPREVTYLRQYANYLTPEVGLLSADTWALLGTYVRNAVLNLLILSFGLASLLILPRLWIVLVARTHAQFGPVYACVGLAAFLFAVAAIAYGISREQSPSSDTSRGQGWVLWMTVAPLMLAAAAGSVGLWGYRNGIVGLWEVMSTEGIGQALFKAATPQGIRGHEGRFLIVLLAPGLLYFCAWALGWGCAEVLNRRDRRGPRALAMGQLLRKGLEYFVYAPIAFGVGSVLALVSVVALSPPADTHVRQFATYVASVGAPWLLVILGLTMILHIGLVGRSFADSSREWWSRQGGWIGIVALVWAVLFLFSVYAPAVLQWTYENSREWVKAAAAAGWIGSVWASLWAARNSASGGPGKRGPLGWLALCAPPLVTVALLGGLATIVHFSVSTDVHRRTSDALGTIVSEQMYEAAMTMPWKLGLAWLVCTLACLLLAARVDVNKFSLYMMYRNRLVRTFLGASHAGRNPDAFTGFDGNDDQPLHELAGHGSAAQKPYLIINTTLNLVKGKELAWQTRKAASFVFTPRYCGFETPAMPVAQTLHTANESSRGLYRRTSEYGTGDAEVSEQSAKLGMAMAISGAAASPNMGYHSSSVLSFLMTIFNIRLGRWCGNPAAPSGWKRSSPRIGLYYLIRELFGFTDMGSNFLYLSDGGHFENLGVYELVRRRCRLIVCVDASADRLHEFCDLGSAVRRCYTDFNVRIDIDVHRVRRPSADSEAYCVAGTIHYDDRHKGTLLYIKPCLTGKEPADIYNYFRKNADFPHQSTADQWFDEAQFESYRSLGHYIGTSIFSAVEIRLNAYSLLRASGDRLAGVEALSRAIEQLYGPAPPAPRMVAHPGYMHGQSRVSLRTYGRNGHWPAASRNARSNGQAAARQPD